MKVWVRVCALVAFAGGAGCARAEPGIDPERLNLSLGSADGSAVKADAILSAPLSDIQSQFKVSFEANPQGLTGDPWRPALSAAASRERIDFAAAWTGAGGLGASLSLNDSLDQSWRAISYGMTDAHQLVTDARGAQLALSFRPAPALAFTLAGEAADKSILDVVGGGPAAPPHSQFNATGRNARAGLKWRLASWFSLDAGGKLETASAAWRGALAGGPLTGASLAYAAFEPSLTGTLATPDRGALSLTFERAVSPIDPAVFGAFAGLEGRSSSARLAPNSEWRYRLSLQQKLAGQLQLSAALTQARIDSATELGPAGPGVQAPVSVPGGQRQEFDLSLSAPLAALGLPGFTLKGAGAWRDSQVRDPFTGEYRRASGESPETATLDLTQAAGAGRAKWGLEGRFGGDQSIYQMSQVTSVTVADSLGGFVEYDPGAFALRLQVDGLYGGERTATDAYYSTTRAGGYVDRVDRHTEDGQAVRLVLSKAL